MNDVQLTEEVPRVILTENYKLLILVMDKITRERFVVVFESFVVAIDDVVSDILRII